MLQSLNDPHSEFLSQTISSNWNVKSAER